MRAKFPNHASETRRLWLGWLPKDFWVKIGLSKEQMGNVGLYTFGPHNGIVLSIRPKRTLRHFRLPLLISDRRGSRMPNFAMLKRLSTDTLTRPDSIKRLNRQVREYIEGECPEVKWLAHYGLLVNGRPKFLRAEADEAEEICVYDYLDIFEAPDHATASKVESIVRSFGHAEIELWCDMNLDRITNLLDGMDDFTGRKAEFTFKGSRPKRKQPLVY